MTKVLFVCLGNICRSPLAEGVLRSEIEKRGWANNFKVDSAGTANYHVGDPPDHRSTQVAKNHGIELDHEGRQFTARDFENFNFILVMDDSNLRDVLRLAKTDQDPKKVSMFASYDKKSILKSVPDPYYGNLADFEAVYEQCVRCALGFLEVHFKS